MRGFYKLVVLWADGGGGNQGKRAPKRGHKQGTVACIVAASN